MDTGVVTRAVSVLGLGALSVIALSAVMVPATTHVPGQVAPDFDIVVELNVEIPMRDGMTLRADMLRPARPGKFPTLVYRTPYGKHRYLAANELPRKAAQAGFLVFVVDVRGRYASEGTFRAYHQEGADGYDTIEWAAAHEFSDGNVGTWGFSYPGFVQWLALAEDPPHLATAVPAMTPVGSHHFFYMGGAFYFSFMEWFHGSMLPDLRRRAGDTSGSWDLVESRTAWAAERMRWYMHRPLVDIPHMRRHAPFFYDWLTHPDLDAWWDFANVEDDFETMRAPVLLLSGWYDSAYGTEGAVRGFQGMRQRAATAEARDNTRLILGPWEHSSIDVLNTSVYDREFGPAAGIDFDALRLRWFERWVAGRDNGLEADPPVRLFVMGENRWRAETEFPLSRARSTPLYLHGGEDSERTSGTLSYALPGEGASTSNYVYDPADPVWEPLFMTGSLDQTPMTQRQDVLVFTSEPLPEDLEVTGEIVARLHVSSDRPDTDFAVTVCDVYPDGVAYTLTGSEAGYLRMRYREGFDHQVPMVPGETYEISIGGLWTSNLFRRGHRIQVMITSSRAPHFDPNPNTGGEIATERTSVPASQTLFHDQDRPSRILLPVIPRSSDGDPHE